MMEKDNSYLFKLLYHTGRKIQRREKRMSDLEDIVTECQGEMSGIQKSLEVLKSYKDGIYDALKASGLSEAYEEWVTEYERENDGKEDKNNNIRKHLEPGNGMLS